MCEMWSLLNVSSVITEDLSSDDSDSILGVRLGTHSKPEDRPVVWLDSAWILHLQKSNCQLLWYNSISRVQSTQELPSGPYSASHRVSQRHGLARGGLHTGVSAAAVSMSQLQQGEGILRRGSPGAWVECSSLAHTDLSKLSVLTALWPSCPLGRESLRRCTTCLLLLTHSQCGRHVCECGTFAPLLPGCPSLLKSIGDFCKTCCITQL